jgi:hypothetical protein
MEYDGAPGWAKILVIGVGLALVALGIRSLI